MHELQLSLGVPRIMVFFREAQSSSCGVLEPFEASMSATLFGGVAKRQTQQT
jgi:hypothetical protein